MSNDEVTELQISNAVIKPLVRLLLFQKDKYINIIFDKYVGADFQADANSWGSKNYWDDVQCALVISLAETPHK